RPWEEPVDGEIEGGSGQYQARWWLNARGPMRLTLRVEDPWVGETTVVDQVVQVGGEMEQREYVRQLREASRHRRGVGGLHAVFERFFARDAPPAELGELAASADTAATTEIFRTLVGLVERGVPVPVEQLDWSHLGASLAALSAGGTPPSEVTREMTALLEAVAESEPSPNLAHLLAALGLPAWRALGSTGLPDGLRRKLWAVWPPLAAMLESKHLQEPQAAERWRVNIGEPLSSREDAMKQWGNRLKVLRQLQCSRGTPGQVATPGPLLTDEGWQRAVWADRQRLNADGRVLERGPEPADLKKFAADVQRTWQRDFAAQLRLPGGPVSWPDGLPWMSLVLACWQRLYARSRVAGSHEEVARALRLAAHVARAMPNVYERDLCLAEALQEVH
uniref:hypothetical protein n=1 Tax=Tepidiforma sp. TaxID=2682230 RepID=UPI002ADD4231